MCDIVRIYFVIFVLIIKTFINLHWNNFFHEMRMRKFLTIIIINLIINRFFIIFKSVAFMRLLHVCIMSKKLFLGQLGTMLETCKYVQIQHQLLFYKLVNVRIIISVTDWLLWMLSSLFYVHFTFIINFCKQRQWIYKSHYCSTFYVFRLREKDC